MHTNLSSENHIHAEQHGANITITIKLEDVFNGKECHPKPEEHDPGVKILYVINLDGKEYDVPNSKMTGAEILALGGYSPNTRRLFELGHSQRPVELHEIVDFIKPGIERFRSMPKSVNEGKGSADGALPTSCVISKDFELLPVDNTFLEKQQLPWKTTFDPSGRWVIIQNFPVPDGYNVTSTTLAFMLPASFPTTEIDMMYFQPRLERADGKTIGALSDCNVAGSIFQRWSRHRAGGEWCPDVDNVETHVLSVTAWLQDELRK